MVDFNTPTTPVTPEVTPTPMPVETSTVNTTSTTSTVTTNTEQTMVPKKKKSKLWILLVLLLLGGGYVYYTFFMMKEVTPVIIPDMTNTGMDTMMNTGDSMADTGNSMGEDTLSGETTITMEREDTDQTRRMDLAEIASALETYFAINSVYPMAEVFEQSILMYMDALPMDPNETEWTSFNSTTVSGYVYSPLMRAGKMNMASMLMARTFTAEGSNWVDADPALSQVSNISRADASAIEKMICSSITMDETTVDSLKNCTAKMGSDKLRYIYIK